jgi:hypothetical protein
MHYRSQKRKRKKANDGEFEKGVGMVCESIPLFRAEKSSKKNVSADLMLSSSFIFWK